MKKLFSKLRLICLLTCTLLALCCLASCGGGKAKGEVVYQAEKMVVIRAGEVEDGATLKSVMYHLQDEGKLTFTVDGDGLITSINGYTATGNEYWALYTSDTDYATTQWGSTEYNGKIYGSSSFGYDTLPVVEEGIYIWEIATW